MGRGCQVCALGIAVEVALRTRERNNLNGPREPILIDPIFNRDAILQVNAGSE